MVTLKEFFAFPMFATSLWLIWVFSLQTNTEMLISLLIALLVISTLFWSLTKLDGNIKKSLIWILILIIIITEGVEIVSSDAKIEADNLNNQNDSEYTIWDSNIERRFREDDQAYLINFTAAWCITCQANDKLALSRPSIKNYLLENNIEYIVADWTNKNDEILSALESYERNGVPLYVYWKPGLKDSVILPAILTEQILLESF
jgi:thiol:disulfide interchange protein DsbD